MHKFDFTKAAELTANNMHSLALAEVARVVEHDRAQKIFNHLHNIHMLEGELTEHVQIIRRQWSDKLHIYIGLQHGVEIQRKAHDCL